MHYACNKTNIQPTENMVGVNMVLAEFVKFKHGLYKSCGIEWFEGIFDRAMFTPTMFSRGRRMVPTASTAAEEARGRRDRGSEDKHIMLYIYIYIMYVCMYVCIYIYIYIMCPYIYIYIHMYTYTYMPPGRMVPTASMAAAAARAARPRGANT